jgi:hypothetical protein
MLHSAFVIAYVLAGRKLAGAVLRRGLPARSRTLPLSTKFNPTVPEPAIPFTVTMYELGVPPPPTTTGVDAVAPPPSATEKSLASTPVTCSLNVTAKLTLDAPVVDAPVRAIDNSDGYC